jgi:hypothetical protein
MDKGVNLFMIYTINLNKKNIDSINEYLDDLNDPEQSFDEIINIFLREGIESAKRKMMSDEWVEYWKESIRDQSGLE